MELICPEFLRFKDRVAVPYTALYAWVCLAARAVDCKSITKKHRWFESTPAHFLFKKSVYRSEDSQSLLKDITLGPSRTRENKESSSQDFIFPISRRKSHSCTVAKIGKRRQ